MAGQNIGPVNIMVGAIIREASTAIKQILTEYESAEGTLKAKRPIPFNLFSSLKAESAKLKESHTLVEQLEQAHQAQLTAIQKAGESQRLASAAATRAKFTELQKLGEADARAKFAAIDNAQELARYNAWLSTRATGSSGAEVQKQQVESATLAAASESANEKARYQAWLSSRANHASGAEIEQQRSLAATEAANENARYQAWLASRANHASGRELQQRQQMDDADRYQEWLKTRSGPTQGKLQDQQGRFSWYEKYHERPVPEQRYTPTQAELQQHFDRKYWLSTDGGAKSRLEAAQQRSTERRAIIFSKDDENDEFRIRAEAADMSRRSMAERIAASGRNFNQLTRAERELTNATDRFAAIRNREVVAADHRIRQENANQRMAVRRGIGSGTREFRYASMQGAFAVEDAMISYQYGGVGASARAAANNLTAIAATAIPNPMLAAGTIVGISALAAAIGPLSRALGMAADESDNLTKSLSRFATETQQRFGLAFELQDTDYKQNRNQMENKRYEIAGLDAALRPYEQSLAVRRSQLMYWETVAAQTGNPATRFDEYNTAKAELDKLEGSDEYKKLLSSRTAAFAEFQMRDAENPRLLERYNAAQRREDREVTRESTRELENAMYDALDRLNPEAYASRSRISRDFEERRMGLMGTAMPTEVRQRLIASLDAQEQFSLFEYEQKNKVKGMDKPFNTALEVGSRQAAEAQQKLMFGLDGKGADKEQRQRIFEKVEAILKELQAHRPKTPRTSSSK